MAKRQPFGHRYQVTLDDDRTVEIMYKIELDRILKVIARRADRRKSRMASTLYGLIKVKVLTPQKPPEPVEKKLPDVILGWDEATARRAQERQTP